jgi:hypothetical protein
MKNGKSGRKGGWRGEKDEFCVAGVSCSDWKANGDGDLVADWGRMRSGSGGNDGRKEAQKGARRNMNARTRTRTTTRTIIRLKLPFLFGGKCG